MKRREFLKYSAAFGTLLLAPSVIYANSTPDITKDKKEKEKGLIQKIIKENSNFNYKAKVLTEDWAGNLGGLGYIIEESKKILNEEDREYTAVSVEKTLNMPINNFKKLITANPYFIIPLTTKILIDSKKTKDGIIKAASIMEGGLEKGLWYVEKGDSKKKIRGKASIPYSNENIMLVYGEGKRWGVKGKFISIMNYEEVDKNTKLNIHFFVDSVGTGFFSKMYAGGEFVANMVKDSAMDLIKNSEKLVNVLKYNKNKITKEKYGEREVSYLNELDI